ncbi:MAG: F0F1 ATP synthase subunit B [Chthonomonas sp.]|nr:F0F1 ATP synthase subunit B [Chthonomonas sp.]
MATQKSSGIPYIVKLIVGVGMAVGGFKLSHMAHEPGNGLYDITHKMSEMGIPIDLGITIAVIGVFLIVFPAIQSFYVTPLEDAVNERTSRLESTFSEAESLRSEMTQMKADYETRLAKAEGEARAAIQEEIKKAQDLRAQMQAEVAAQRADMLKKAEDEISAQRAGVVSQLRTQTVNLTMSATEKLIGAKLDSEADRKLIEEFIDKAEVPSF